MRYYEKMIEVAKAELGNAEPLGDDKYIKRYNELTGSRFALNVAWCAMFVTWVADIVGVTPHVIPHYASCDSGRRWFQKRKQWENAPAYGGSYVPKAGDIAFFSSKNDPNDSTHTGIVIEINKDNELVSIEGNTRNKVGINCYDLKSKYILGYGIPKYPDAAPADRDSKPRYAMVENGTSLNVRSGAGTEFDKIDTIYNNSKRKDLLIIANTEDNGWHEIVYFKPNVNGKNYIPMSGFASGKYIKEILS